MLETTTFPPSSLMPKIISFETSKYTGIYTIQEKRLLNIKAYFILKRVTNMERFLFS